MSADKNISTEGTGGKWIAVVAGILTAGLSIAVALWSPFAPRSVHVVVRVFDDRSFKGIPYAQLRLAAKGASFSGVSDSDGMATFTVPVERRGSSPLELTVLADGFETQTLHYSADNRDAVLAVSLTPAKGSANAKKQVNTMDVLSGDGASWGNLYRICSSPAANDYRVVASEFELLAGDRKCGLYAECSESSHSNSEVCWTVRFQGHGEDSATTRRIKGKAVLTVILDKVNVPSPRITEICHFYGEANQGASAWNNDNGCLVPESELLDLAFHQSDFVCCGGGASSTATNASIPGGLEVHVSGAHYWAVGEPRLEGNQFRIHTYCGPGAAPGPGCNVDVRVIAHYRKD